MSSPPASSSSSPSSHSPVPSDDRPSTSSSSENAPTSSEVHEEENSVEEGDPEPTDEFVRRSSGFSHQTDYLPRWWQRLSRTIVRPEVDETHSFLVREDNWSCIIVILTFWFFVSLTLIMGIYGSETIELSPYSSILLQPNQLFVQHVKVEKSDGRKSGAVLYGMYKTPTLNGSKTWSESVSVSMEIKSIKEWALFLNKGSELNISYNVRSTSL